MGNYYSDKAGAEKNYARRIEDYKEQFSVKERAGEKAGADRPSITAQLGEAAHRPEAPKEPAKTKHYKSHEDR